MTLAALYIALALIAGSFVVWGVCLRIRDNRDGKHRWAEEWSHLRGRRCGDIWLPGVSRYTPGPCKGRKR